MVPARAACGVMHPNRILSTANSCWLLRTLSRRHWWSNSCEPSRLAALGARLGGSPRSRHVTYQEADDSGESESLRDPLFTRSTTRSAAMESAHGMSGDSCWRAWTSSAKCAISYAIASWPSKPRASVVMTCPLVRANVTGPGLWKPSGNSMRPRVPADRRGARGVRRHGCVKLGLGVRVAGEPAERERHGAIHAGGSKFVHGMHSAWLAEHHDGERHDVVAKVKECPSPERRGRSAAGCA